MRRLEAVHEAMMGAQQSALADKMARRKPPVSDQPTRRETSAERQESAPSSPRQGADQLSQQLQQVKLVDAQVQTDFFPCRCQKQRNSFDKQYDLKFIKKNQYCVHC